MQRNAQSPASAASAAETCSDITVSCRHQIFIRILITGFEYSYKFKGGWVFFFLLFFYFSFFRRVSAAAAAAAAPSLLRIVVSVQRCVIYVATHNLSRDHLGLSAARRRAAVPAAALRCTNSRPRPPRSGGGVSIWIGVLNSTKRRVQDTQQYAKGISRGVPPFLFF